MVVGCVLKYCLVARWSLRILLKLHFWGSVKCSKDALVLLEMGYNAAITECWAVRDTKTKRISVTYGEETPRSLQMSN